MSKCLNPLITDQFGEIFDPRQHPKDQFYCYVQHRPDGTPFYVGKGKGWRCFNSRRNKAYDHVIEKYGYENIKTNVFICSSEKSAFQWEKELIFMLRSRGYRLFNMTDGGDGAANPSVETREKRAKATKGVPKSLEHRLKIAASHRGKKKTPETCKAISEGKRKMRVVSPFKGKKGFPSTRKGKKGPSPSEETRAKTSASLREFYAENDVWNKGKPSVLKGRKQSPEIIAIFTAAQQLRRAKERTLKSIVQMTKTITAVQQLTDKLGITASWPTR